MSTHTSTIDIYDTLGKPDGTCVTCGAPARRMGWSGDYFKYWRMCDASKLSADDDRYGRCKLPTLAIARQRISAQ